MIAFISPAKKMRPTTMDTITPTQPLFLSQAAALADVLRQLAPWQLESTMKLNAQLALDVFGQFQEFDASRAGTPALLTYDGLQYKNLDARTLSREELLWAQDHAAILSGLYGFLRPLDGVLPYRLEMQYPVPFDGKTLYKLWGDRLYRALFQKGEVVLDLASKEYSKAVTPYLTGHDRMISCEFLVPKGKKLRALATESKMARGQMLRYLIKNKIDDPAELMHFSWNGYCFAPASSTDSHYVFVKTPLGGELS